MQKLKIAIVTFFLALILIAGGVWGYLWYSTKQQMDQIVALAQPFANISYRGIEVSPFGSVGVNRLQIILHSVNDFITIDAIRLNAPNILALLNTGWQLRRGQLPEALWLSIEQFAIALDGGILGAQQTQESPKSPLGDLDALGCGPVKALGAAEWREMGYSNLAGNIIMGYRLNPSRTVLELQIDSHGQDWAALNLNIGLATTAPVSSIMELATSLTPKLARLNVVARDEGFNQRRNQYCAAKAGKAVAAYITDHIQLVLERLRANGISPGPGLVEAYRAYLTEGGQLAITASPPAPINPGELQFYKPEDVVTLAGLTVKVNDKPVTDLSLSWDNAKIARLLKAKPESAPEAVEPPTAPTTPEAPAVTRKAYHPIAVSEVSQHVGKIAKIKTAGNTEYKGQLEAIAEGLVKITIRKPGGSATLSLRIKDITEAQVVY